MFSGKKVLLSLASFAPSRITADAILTRLKLVPQIRLYTHNTKIPHPPNFKIGQLRMYMRGLEEQDLLYLMSSAKWSNGKSVQQCVSSVSIKWFTPISNHRRRS